MPSRPVVPSASPEQLLLELGKSVHPSADARERVRMRMRANIVTVPVVLRSAREQIQPASAARNRIWERIAGAASLVKLPLWDQVVQALSPDPLLRRHVWERIVVRLHPAYARVLVSRPLKIIAAFAVLLLVVRLSPVLFLAPTTVAESALSVRPTRGQVEILIGGLWQPVSSEVLLQQAAVLQTQDGEATVVLHDDAVIRMAPFTTLAVNDTADRPEPSLSQPTLSLQRGTIWMLGLVPRGLEGITIGTSQGRILVQEGSVSVAENGSQTTLQVWYRSAVAMRRGQQLSLVAGERVVLAAGTTASSISTIGSALYEDPWVNRNLAMDGAHQREIAELQQQRRAANAGILPDSTLYPAKRFAEAVDVLFTFTSEQRAKKLLSQAGTRLNEAAALLERGDESDASKPLREYRETLLAVASGSVKSPEVESLLRQEVATASADVSAALPDDSSYVIKQAVRGAIAALPTTVEKQDAQAQTEAAELLDQLTAVKHRADEGEVSVAKAELEKIRMTLPAHSSGAKLPDEVRKEVEATLTSITAALGGRATESTIEIPLEPSRATQRTLDRIAGRGRSSSSVAPEPLSAEKIAEIVLQIRNRVIQGYDSDSGRSSVLRLEFSRLSKYPERLAILRELYVALRPYGLGEEVRKEMQQ